MLKLDKKFFFRTTWFPEGRRRFARPWNMDGMVFSANFPSGLHYNHVSGAGELLRGKDGPLALTEPLEVITKKNNKLKKKKIPVAGKKRKEVLSTVKRFAIVGNPVGILHPTLKRRISSETLGSLARGAQALENIFSAVTRHGDHRQPMEHFQSEFKLLFGKKVVTLGEVFSRMNFPRLQRSAGIFPPPLERLLISLSDMEEVHLDPRLLRELEKSSAPPLTSERIQRGYLRTSSVEISGSWFYILHDISSSAVVSPFSALGTLQHELRRRLTRGLSARHREIIHAFPEGFVDTVKGVELLDRSIRLDEEDWKKFTCQLRGKKFVLKDRRQEVVPVLSVPVARELIPSDVFRFLASVGDQGAPTRIGWLWPQAPEKKRFPRVSLGNVILSPAYWVLSPAELFSCQAKASRLKLGLPENVFVCHGSEKFLLNFQDKVMLNKILERVLDPRMKPSPVLRIEESFADGFLGARTSDGSSFREETYFSFKHLLR